MGKQRKMKQIRKLAATFPTVMRDTVEYHYMTGKELKSELDVDQINGVPVKDDETCRYTYPVKIAINHNRKLKRMYDKHGIVGMVAYAKAVDAHIKNNTP